MIRDWVIAAAEHLINKRNPYDGGWGLHIEKMTQTSSIVNTTEAIYVIKAANQTINDLERTIEYLKNAVIEHPNTRGDNLRYYVFGLLGLLEAGVDVSDPFITTVCEKIEKRYLQHLGWAEHFEEKEPRMWQTFLGLLSLSQVFGTQYVFEKYEACLTNIVSIGKANNSRWGWSLVSSVSSSLAATAYALIILSFFFPDEPTTVQARESTTQMLIQALESQHPVEVEPISGTDWNHYSYSWGLRALHWSDVKIDKAVFKATVMGIKYTASLFDGQGFTEPGKQDCNVRSIYNNVMAIDAVTRSFDPQHYVYLSEFIFPELGSKGDELSF